MTSAMVAACDRRTLVGMEKSCGPGTVPVVTRSPLAVSQSPGPRNTASTNALADRVDDRHRDESAEGAQHFDSLPHLQGDVGARLRCLQPARRAGHDTPYQHWRMFLFD